MWCTPADIGIIDEAPNLFHHDMLSSIQTIIEQCYRTRNGAHDLDQDTRGGSGRTTAGCCNTAFGESRKHDSQMDACIYCLGSEKIGDCHLQGVILINQCFLYLLLIRSSRSCSFRNSRHSIRPLPVFLPNIRTRVYQSSVQVKLPRSQTVHTSGLDARSTCQKDNLNYGTIWSKLNFHQQFQATRKA